jgi:hypothetical protein
MDYNTLIINLKILAQLDTGVKLNTRNKYFILDTVNWFQGLLRTYRRDTRDVTYEKICSLIKDVKDLVNDFDYQRVNLEFESKEAFHEYIKPILEDALDGLKTLKTTYGDDQTFVAQISLEIDKLERITNSIKIPVKDNAEVSI